MDEFRKRFWLYYTDYNRTIILTIGWQMLLVVVDNYTSLSLWFIYFPDFFIFFLSSFDNDKIKTGLCFDDKNVLSERSKRQGRTSCFTMNYVTLCNNMQDHSCNTVPYPVAWVGVTAVKLANS